METVIILSMIALFIAGVLIVRSGKKVIKGTSGGGGVFIPEDKKEHQTT